MVNFAKAIAGNSDLFTAQAFVYQSNNLNLVMLITGEGEDVFTKVRMAASLVESSFFETEEPVPARLDKCLALIKEQLKDFTNIEVLLAVWHESILYILNEGSHKAYLLREDNLIDLSSDQLISGHIQKGDKLLFLTNSLLEYISPKDDKSFEIKSLLKMSPEFFDEEINALWRGEEAASDDSGELKEDEEDQTEGGSEDVEARPEVSEILHTKKPVAAVLINFALEQKDTEVFSKLKDNQFNSFNPNFNPFRVLKILLKRRLIFFLIPLLIVLFALGIGYYYFNQQTQDKIQELNSLKIQAREKYSQAQSLKELDPQAAAASLKEAENLVNQAIALSPEDSEAKALRDQIKEQSPSILKVSSITEWPTYLSLDLLRKDFKADRLSFSLGKILMLDPDKKTLIVVDLENKNPEVLAGEEQLGDAKFASLNGDFAFVYSEDKGILRVDTKNKKTTVVIKPDNEWGRIQDIYGFASNIYLLDGLKNQVWKYVPVENGYSEKAAYFKNSQKDLVNAKSLYIDGSIWLLKSGPEILRFTSGIPDNFSVSGLDKNLGDIAVFFVDDTTDNLYALDRTNSRLVAFEKNGKYVSQISGDKFKTALDMVVDEEGKKVYLLEGNKIYTADLN